MKIFGSFGKLIDKLFRRQQTPTPPKEPTQPTPAPTDNIILKPLEPEPEAPELLLWDQPPEQLPPLPPPPPEPPPVLASPPPPEGSLEGRLINPFLYLFFGGIALVALFFLYGVMFGEREIVAPPPAGEAVTAASATGVTSTPFLALLVIGVVILLIWRIAYKDMPEAWAFAILLGVTTFHWLFWAVSPNVWSAWFHSQVFWPMNVAIILAAFFASQKGVAARYAGFTLGILVLAAIGIGTYKYFPLGSKQSTSTIIVTPLDSPQRLTADIALPIIAQCESGGRQFDDDGNVITSSTDDIGKWQIHLPDHWGRAESLGINLWTEEGNEKFARILYAENGLKDWEASRTCWEPKLMAIPATKVFTVTASTGKPVQIIVPQGWRWDITTKPIPKTYYTDLGRRDPRGRIQIFEVVPPATEVTLEITYTECTTPQMCAW